MSVFYITDNNILKVRPEPAELLEERRRMYYKYISNVNIATSSPITQRLRKMTRFPTVLFRIDKSALCLTLSHLFDQLT
jgi:hypothetical protein